MSIQPDFNHEELLGHIADVLEGNLTDERAAALNQMLKQSTEARRIYQEHMGLHARLHLDYAGVPVVEHMPGSPVRRKARRFPLRWVAGVAAAACLILLVWPRQAESSRFATLEKVHSAKWASSDLPTTEGSRLGEGTLRLAEGLVTLRFDSGANVNVEGPAEITLDDEMQCTVSNGIVVADIPDSAIGFRIVTPSAEVVDYGTRFSVVVDGKSGLTHTQVYDGLVEVEDSRTGSVLSLKKGEKASTGKTPAGRGRSIWPASIGPTVRGLGWRLLETRQDAYIGRAYQRNAETHRSQSLLLVKNGDVQRKAYLGFDLQQLRADEILDAELTLMFEPTGWGLSSLVPDATFGVYGLLTDEAWEEETLDEHNAPANQWRSRRAGRAGGGTPELAPDKVRQLGSFVIEQGVQRGEFGIKGNALAEFLRERAGTEITLIVVRETRETETNGLVHGFASRRHPTLRPPTLAIHVNDS